MFGAGVYILHNHVTLIKCFPLVLLHGPFVMEYQIRISVWVSLLPCFPILDFCRNSGKKSNYKKSLPWPIYQCHIKERKVEVIVSSETRVIKAPNRFDWMCRLILNRLYRPSSLTPWSRLFQKLMTVIMLMRWYYVSELRLSWYMSIESRRGMISTGENSWFVHQSSLPQ
jgi:hypothetical protein